MNVQERVLHERRNASHNSREKGAKGKCFIARSFSPNEHYVNFTRPTTNDDAFVVCISNVYSLRRNVEQKTKKHEERAAIA